jgi:hypothetical protein
MRQIRNAYKILIGRVKRAEHSEDLEVDGRIILMKYYGKVWTGFIWLWIRTGGGLLRIHESSGSKKWRENFLTI